MDRKPSITITLSSDGEADDDDAAVIVDEELKANTDLWMEHQEKVIEDKVVKEEGLEEVVEVAKEDIAANLEAEANVAEAGDESKTGEEKQTDSSEATNAENDDEREDKEDEDVKQTDSNEGARITLALVGKLANVISSNKDATPEEGEEEEKETVGIKEEDDSVKENSRADAEVEEVDKMVKEGLLQGEEAHQVVHPGFV